MDAGASRGTTRFGPFELDLQSGELSRLGRKVRLQGQSFQILEVLLARPGDVVTRDELHKGLWPADTYVDFEHGLNNAIKRLREALGDSADKPRYVETLPRKGYRFIGEIKPPGFQPALVIASAATASPSPPPLSLPFAEAPRSRPLRPSLLISATLITTTGIILFFCLTGTVPRRAPHPFHCSAATR